MNRENRWFDWSLLVQDLAARLSHDADCYRKLGITEDAGKTAEEMERVADLLSEAVSCDQYFEGNLREQEARVKELLHEALNLMADKLMKWWD